MGNVSLPYTDTKSQGAAGFYSGINAAFRYILNGYGPRGWRRYLEEMGRGYFAKCNRQWAHGGLPALAAYWRAFFKAEPGAVVEVRQLADRVEIQVVECPAIKHLRMEGCDIVTEYCQHCFFLGSARAAEAGFTMRLRGGNGSCLHTYAQCALPPQDMAEIEEVR